MMRMDVKSAAFTIAMLSVVGWSEALDGERGERFLRCRKGWTYPSNTTTGAGRSPMDCLQMCSQTYECSGVTICPAESADHYTCDMTSDDLQGTCDGLAEASQPACYFAQRKEIPVRTTTTPAPTTTTTTPAPSTTLWCRNGGTLNGNQCDCPFQFAGPDCQRPLRDCSEAFDNGKTSGDGELLIQPAGASAPFKVRCQYSWGGATTLLRWRSAVSNFNQDLTTLKAGIPGDPLQDDFFVGLDNLHFFTSQAAYELNWNLNWGNYHIYDNFTVGPESTSYRLSYQQCTQNTFGNGFNVAPPLKFSASGHDPDGCYAGNGLAGWYGAGCAGYPTFSGSDVTWPGKSGGTVSVYDIIAKFVRKSPYYNN